LTIVVVRGLLHPEDKRFIERGSEEPAYL